MQRWGSILGIDGNLYHGRYFDVMNDDDLKKHILLEFLSYLKVIQYVRDHDVTYEIIIKARYEA